MVLDVLAVQIWLFTLPPTLYSVKKYLVHSIQCQKVYYTICIASKSVLLPRSPCFSRSAGIQDTPDNLWNFFISRIRKNLHMSICFSPVGDGMRNRAKKFPALITLRKHHGAKRSGL